MLPKFGLKRPEFALNNLWKPKLNYWVTQVNLSQTKEAQVNLNFKNIFLKYICDNFIIYTLKCGGVMTKYFAPQNVGERLIFKIFIIYAP